MAINVGNIVASLQLNMRDFTKGMQQAQKVLHDAFGPKTRNEIAKTKQELSSTALGLRDVERIVGGIVVSQLFYRMANQIQTASASLVTYMNDMQKAQIAMEYFLGSAEKSAAFIYNMKDFAAVTAFNTQQALTLSRRLMAAQFEPAKIRSVMEILNDASAATGGTAEQMDRIVLALSQIKTNGKIAGQEMRQLAEAGIPIYKLLQEELGLTGEELMNIGDLKISGDLGVEAVLRGLEKRYKGAADRIANTMGGMWDTIRDDALMIGEGVFSYPYKLMERSVRSLRDTMEEARHTIARGGIGALFEKMFSPRLQMYIRNILASVKSLIQSFGILAAAVMPSIAYIFDRLTVGFSMILSPLAAFVRALAVGTHMAMTLIPPLKYLLAAILSLSVAATVGKLLMILWRVTGIGLICTTVAKAVGSLTTAIKGLYAVVLATATPVMASIMLIAGALTFLGIKTGAFTKIADMFHTAMSKLTGVDPKKILQPTSNNASTFLGDFNKDATDVNKNLKDITKNTKKVGDSAKKAGKKIKDTFIQSFDEVFLIPDKLDSTKDTLDEMPSAVDTPTLDMGNIALPDIPSTSGIFEGITADLGKVNESLNISWGKIWQWSKDTYMRFNQWSIDTGKRLFNWSVETGKSVFDWSKETYDKFSNWSIETSLVFINWIANQLTRFSEWRTNIKKNFNDWVYDNVSKLGKWSTDTAKSFDTWYKGTSSKLGTWFVDTYRGFNKWRTDTRGTVYAFAYEAAKKLADAGAGMKKTFGSVWTVTKSYFKALYNDVKPYINMIIRMVNKMIDGLNSVKIKIPTVYIPFIGTVGGGSINLPRIPKIPELETGGIVKKDQLVRVGEKNRREAVVPLENPQYMKPFSDAVANQLLEVLGTNNNNNNGGNEKQPTVYVHTLIADDRGLKELKRKMNVIELKEESRGVKKR